MSVRTRAALLGVFLALLSGGCAVRRPEPAHELRVLSWNIWHGGREDGAAAGPAKVADVIRRSAADVVAMQETYGSGEQISRELGFHLLARGNNVSLHSRYPILEDLSVFEPFKCVGALIECPGGRRVAVFSIWLPYDSEIWERGTRPSGDSDALLAACRSSAVDLEVLRAAIDERLAGPAYRGVPVVIAGDFNSMSHLDYAEIARDQYGDVVPWATSQVLSAAGYRDAYRELRPSIDRAADRTWSPRFREQEQDRIDFVYYRGDGVSAVAAERIDEHPAGFPSDHAAVLVALRLSSEAAARTGSLRTVSYNIRHARGMDGQVDLARTAAALERFAPDLVGLQEVDLRVQRSGAVNQAAELGRRLGMHAAFGTFMDLQGGWYGIGFLSRFPIISAHSLALPTGNEPRVALAAEVRLPDGQVVLVVTVHFDWVEDDGFRHAQAAALAAQLREVRTPFILLGDFNDLPESRTLALFRAIATEVEKHGSAADRFTFSSTAPAKEIDYLFVAPAERWDVTQGVRVVDDPLTSDHRALFAELRLVQPQR